MDATVALRDDGPGVGEDHRGLPDSAKSESGDAIDSWRNPAELSVVLQPGVPLMVAQSADAVGDRRVALEVTATVLK